MFIFLSLICKRKKKWNKTSANDDAKIKCFISFYASVPILKKEVQESCFGITMYIYFFVLALIEFSSGVDQKDSTNSHNSEGTDERETERFESKSSQLIFTEGSGPCQKYPQSKPVGSG